MFYDPSPINLIKTPFLCYTEVRQSHGVPEREIGGRGRSGSEKRSHRVSV